MAEARYFELLRARTPAQRAAILAGLSSSVRRLAMASIREKHPTASRRELEARLAERLYGVEARRRLFPDLPLE